MCKYHLREEPELVTEPAIAPDHLKVDWSHQWTLSVCAPEHSPAVRCRSAASMPRFHVPGRRSGSTNPGGRNRAADIRVSSRIHDGVDDWETHERGRRSSAARLRFNIRLKRRATDLPAASGLSAALSELMQSPARTQNRFIDLKTLDMNLGPVLWW